MRAVSEINITLAEVKEALRIDYDDEDTYLQLCLDAAKGYVEDAIDDYALKVVDVKFHSKAKMVIVMAVQNMFDNRVFSTIDNNKNTEKVKYIITSLMVQMRWA